MKDDPSGQQTDPPTKAAGTTGSGLELKTQLGPEDIKHIDPEGDLGAAGAYPYTRGIHESMYRGRLWTMRQYAGYATAEQTNRRFRFLLSQGQTGLSVAFDLPTQMGYDSDHNLARGEVGRVGVAIDTLADMEALFEGIPLGRVSTSMTINSTAAILLAMYNAVGRKQGVETGDLRGTVQNDILKEYVARGTYIFPPEPSLRLVTDIIDWTAREARRFNSISISGYHIREAGATAVQELAFTLAHAVAYVEAALSRGLKVDDFAPRLSFFFSAHNDLLEEVAKFRAARRLYARLMKERFGAKDPRSLTLRFHVQTAGSTLQAAEVDLNVVRVAMQALAAVLGGCQSLHTNSRDEALGLPSEEAALLALRTQQLLAHETGVGGTADPLGGSYAVEWLTGRIESETEDLMKRVDAMGGALRAIEAGFEQRAIEDSAYRHQRELEQGQRVVVGVNAFRREKAAASVPTFRVDPALEASQRRALEDVRRKRDDARVRQALSQIEHAARGSADLMAPIIEAVEAYASVGEISDCLRSVFGEYRPG